MAAIYIHIPFCKTRCVYCDFYSTTQSQLKKRYIRALCQELRSRKEYLKGEPVRTVYFGGGTPSQLNEEDFALVFETLEEVYGLEACEETTLEANPDDLTDDYVAMLHDRLPFNRISMGIQTFDDEMLRLLNRRHNARQSIEAVGRCRRAGFGNISIDLIYGLPGETDRRWQDDLQQAVALDVFFSALTDTLGKAGYVHYEISNFCKPGRHSRHNTSYWQGIPYLGCGPSAHSFNGVGREWNVSSLTQYIEGMESGNRPFETEYRDTATRYNECVMTALRTMWGIPMEQLRQDYGEKLYRYCLDMAAPYLTDGKLELKDGFLRLTRRGIFVSDGIMSDLMYVDD